MKLLEKGKPWSLVVMCEGNRISGGCDSKLLIEEEDIQLFGDGVYGAVCEVCTCRIEIPESKIRTRVIKRVNEEHRVLKMQEEECLRRKRDNEPSWLRRMTDSERRDYENKS
jgi:hypothetical protein